MQHLQKLAGELTAASALGKNVYAALLAFMKEHSKDQDEPQRRSKLVDGTKQFCSVRHLLKSCIATYNATFKNAAEKNTSPMSHVEFTQKGGDIQPLLDRLQTMAATLQNALALCDHVVLNLHGYIRNDAVAPRTASYLNLRSTMHASIQNVIRLKTHLRRCQTLIKTTLQILSAPVGTSQTTLKMLCPPTDTELKHLLVRLSACVNCGDAYTEKTL